MVYSSDLRISFESEGFPPRIGPAHGWNTLITTWDEIIWAALTIGRPSIAHVFQHGDASLHEALFRMSLVRMALQQEMFSGHLERSQVFQFLDPTEKGMISYFLGMTFCKLFAHRFLHTPWLLHLDVFRHQLNPAILSGRSRPDLVGQDTAGDWHAFESKGRSSTPNDEAKGKAKDQAQRLVQIGPSRCRLHIGAVAYFRAERLEFYWRDPDPNTGEPFKAEIPGGAWRYYYEPALAISDPSGEESAARADGLPGRGADVKVSIAPEIRESLELGEWDAARRTAFENQADLVERGFFPDGLSVSCGPSWPNPFGG